MRFCMVTTYYPPYHFGGDAVFVRNLAQDLVHHGHQVEIVHCLDAFQAGSRKPRAATVQKMGVEKDAGVVVHRLHNPLGILSPLITQQTGRPGLKSSALKEILSRDFDVINYHNISLIGGPGVLELGQAPVKLYTLHEHWLLCATHIFWKNGLERCEERTCTSCCLRSGIPPQLWRHSDLIQRSLRHVDLILSPSAYTARQHQESGITAPIRVLPTYVPPSSAPIAKPAQRPRFLFVGRVVASKGLHWLVEQFSKLPQYDLDILGEGDLLLDLKHRYASSSSIHFHGSVEHDQVQKWYSGATALILPSLAPEVFPLCILEAFASGTPAIVSRAGGSPEAVEASGAGFVYSDENTFHTAVTRLAEQPQVRNRLGRLASKAYREHYTPAHYLDRYLSVVNEVLESKAGGIIPAESRSSGRVERSAERLSTPVKH